MGLMHGALMQGAPVIGQAKPSSDHPLILGRNGLRLTVAFPEAPGWPLGLRFGA